MIRAALAIALVTAVTCSPALAAHSSAVACSTKGLNARSGAKVFKVQASGLSCAKALAVAGKVANEVGHNRALTVPGVADFAMSTETCTGCGGTTTEISLGYPSGGKVTISIRGASGGSVTPVPTVPEPQLPAPSGGSGSGPITV